MFKFIPETGVECRIHWSSRYFRTTFIIANRIIQIPPYTVSLHQMN